MYFVIEIVKMKIEVPEQVVVLDPNLSQSNTKFATMVEKYKESHARTYGNVKMHEVLNEPKKDAGKAKNSGNLQKCSFGAMGTPEKITCITMSMLQLRSHMPQYNDSDALAM